MKTRAPLVAIFTAVTGGLTLLTYLVPALLPGASDWAAPLRRGLVEWAIIAAAFALLAGVANLTRVHASNIVRGRSRLDSFVLLASMWVMVPLFYVADVFYGGKGLAQDISGAYMTRLYQYILVPVQATLTSLLPFLLALAAFRAFRLRSAGKGTGATLAAFLFLFTAIVVLLGQVSLFKPLNLPILEEGLGQARAWIMQVVAMGGMRGILLGVALGVTATALRVLIVIGQDSPASD